MLESGGWTSQSLQPVAQIWEGQLPGRCYLPADPYTGEISFFLFSKPHPCRIWVLLPPPRASFSRIYPPKSCLHIKPVRPSTSGFGGRNSIGTSIPGLSKTKEWDPDSWPPLLPVPARGSVWTWGHVDFSCVFLAICWIDVSLSRGQGQRATEVPRPQGPAVCGSLQDSGLRAES